MSKMALTSPVQRINFFCGLEKMVNKANVVAQFVACKIITVLLKSVLYTFFLAGDDHLVYRPALPFIVCTCT